MAGTARHCSLAYSSIIEAAPIRLRRNLLYDAADVRPSIGVRVSLAFEQLRRPAGGFHNISRAFAHRNYRVYISGNGISLIGWWLQRVAVGWLAWTLTHSGTWLGLVSLADFLPVLVLSPFAGALADRRDRVGIIRISQLAGCVQASLLAVLVWTDAITIELLLPARWNALPAGSCARGSCIPFQAEKGSVSFWQWRWLRKPAFSCSTSPRLIWISGISWSCALYCRSSPEKGLA